MDAHGKNTPGLQPRQTYASELVRHRRALTATGAGLASGFLLNHYIANLFAPHLIDEFGWSQADFALVGTVGLINIFCIPIVGRMTDLFGSRAVALVGVVAFPLTFVALSMLSGSLLMFSLIMFLQLLLCGATTSSTVYSRWIAERFVTARGMALAIAATSPALVGVIGTPLLQRVIDSAGWRMGYLAVAAYVAAVGALALLLAPRRRFEEAPAPASATRAAPPRRTAKDYAEVFRSPIFWVLAVAMLLCNLVYPLQSSQMKLMLLSAGASAEAATGMISLFAGGVIAGRFICGVALDRFPTPIVAAVALALPGIGLAVLSAGATEPWLLANAVVLLGMSLGAESDLLPFLVMRYFRLEVYGTVLSLIVGSMALSAALGALVLSATLAATDNFKLYMLLVAVATIVGGGQLLLLGSRRVMGLGQDGRAPAAG